MRASGNGNRTFRKGESMNIGCSQGKAGKGYRLASKMRAYLAQNCHSVPHGDHGGDAISISLGCLSNRAKRYFRTAPPESPSRLTEHLGYGSDTPRFHVFYIDQICARRSFIGECFREVAWDVRPDAVTSSSAHSPPR